MREDEAMSKADDKTTADAEDMRDAALFRLWIRLAEQTPGRVAKDLANCIRADDYRDALSKLAIEHRINLPR